MKKTLLLSAAALTLAGTVALSTHSVSASSHPYYGNPYYNTSRFLRQDGSQTPRQSRQAIQLEIRNLLSTYDITDTNEYNGYYNFYYRTARASPNPEEVIRELKDKLEKR
ncbi:hypothetical protein [Streptococcus pyogenes]|uniref:hypothetical protein n=1 Tax=Streptococcus pyogenes TaxID=1314 RepID=UPI000DA3E789|nr:hypothetical protein [Streptococcus pyogenes]SQE55095.1 Uncharacterised protein [Streptococcus pyogenes]SQE89858.1 Uncharacterised protein [Streptococcus pyogenes]SQF17082.1 Uncharacterised protein [Streptococcus pyogenes]SQF34295.1 Uncharacterised protein [Streptococcus pyogenes]HER2960362.1 hypothetical protein [Streptococcus pyogenes]